jgi:glycosyltransferase involved in cell wall biosynthesis
MPENGAPKISIVTPSFNQGDFLETTMLSVLEQDYPNLEYIVVDGGSQDNSVDIIRKYENRLAWWISEKDDGQVDAINKGMQRATGDILAYLNSDDLYLPGTLQRVAEHFRANPDCGLVYGDYHLVDGGGKLLQRRRELPFDYTMGCCIGLGIIIPQPAAFWTRDTFSRVGLFDPSLHFAMDADYWLRTARITKIEHIPHFLAEFRMHAESKTGIHLDSTTSAYREEFQAILRRSWETLPLSRLLPWQVSKPFRKVWRLKRVAGKLVRGFYKT